MKEIEKEKKKEEERINSLKNKGKKRIVAGIDLSLNCPGIAILNTLGDKVIYMDKYPNKNKKQCKYFRYLEIKLWLDHIIKMFNPGLIIVEEAFMSSLTAKSNVPLLNIHGYIGHYLCSLGIDVYKTTPSASRKHLEITPNTKEGAYEWVIKKYPNLKLESFKKDNDLTDAIVLGNNYDNKELKKIFEK
ncbi:MAG: hypothetical protein ACRCX2_32980 [Paraclostridium sp.]